MDDALADEIFTLSIAAQRIEGRKWEIRKNLGALEQTAPFTWDHVMTAAMKFKVEKLNG